MVKKEEYMLKKITRKIQNNKEFISNKIKLLNYEIDEEIKETGVVVYEK